MTTKVTKKIIKQIKRALFYGVALVIYPLSGLVPRSPAQWAFGNGHPGFGGNPKYLFLWIILNRPKIRATWISGDRKLVQQLQKQGLNASWRWSVKGLWAALRAQVHVYSVAEHDVNFLVSRGAFLVNVWHGIGLKAPKGDKQNAEWWRRGLLLGTTKIGRILPIQANKQPDLLITTSSFTQQHFSYYFDLPLHRCPKLGYPR